MTTPKSLEEIIMLKAFNVRWLESDDTKITFTNEFENTNKVLKIDILEDAIYMLQKKHDEIMNLKESAWTVKNGEIKIVSI